MTEEEKKKLFRYLDDIRSIAYGIFAFSAISCVAIAYIAARIG